MMDERISAKQVVCIMILFILGSNLITGGNMTAKQDAWASLIIGYIIAIPIVAIFAYFKKSFPNKDLFDLSYIAFGKIGGSIITIIFSVYTIRLGSLVIRNFTEFIQVVSLPETPQYINAICFGFISFYTVKKGIEILARGATFVLPVVVITVIILGLLSIKHMNVDYIKPVLAQDWRVIFKGALYNVMFPFAEIAVFIMLFPLVDTKKSPTKLYFYAITFGTLIFLDVVIRNTLVLGMPIMKSVYFPSYSAVGIINIKDFVSRIEVLVTGNFIVSGLVKITVCLYASCKGLAKLFNIKDYKKLAAPIALLMIAIAGFVFDSTMQMFENINNRGFFILTIQVGVPALVLIGAKIKTRKSKTV